MKRSKLTMFKKITFLLLIIIISLSMVISIFLFNKEVINVRLYELQNKLKTLNRSESNRDYISLVMKYKILKKLYLEQVTEDDLPIHEIKITYLYTDSLKEMEEDNKLPSPFVLFLMNKLRTLLNKNRIEITRHERFNQFLDIAYYFERNKYFNKALEVYEKALDFERMDSLNRAVILLHQGFCYSLINNYDLARTKYLKVINDFANEKIAVTAFILLQYIDGFQVEVKKVLSEEDSLEKSKKLYRLIAYDDALQLLNKIEKDAPENEKDQISFYKGRCLEEIGNKKEALAIYHDLIIKNAANQFALLANRRIYYMGATNGKNRRLHELALQNNVLIKDRHFELFTKRMTEFYRTEISIEDKRLSLLSQFTAYPETMTEDIDHLALAYIDEIQLLIKTVQDTGIRRDDKTAENQKNIKIKKDSIQYRDQWVFTYDKKNTPLQADHYNKNGIIDKYDKYHYNKTRRLIAKYRFIPDNVLIEYETYEYNTLGKIIKNMLYNAQDELLMYYTYEYENNGQKATISKYDAEGNLLQKK